MGILSCVSSCLCCKKEPLQDLEIVEQSQSILGKKSGKNEPVIINSRTFNGDNKNGGLNNNYGKHEPGKDVEADVDGILSAHAQLSHLLPGEEGARVSLLAKEHPEYYDSDFTEFGSISTLYDVLRKGRKDAGNNAKCLGWRAEGQESFQWLSYNAVLNRSLNFGRGVTHMGVKEKEFVGIYCKGNEVEWILAEQGLFAFSMVVVPLPHTMTTSACQSLVNQVNLVALIADDERLLQKILGEGFSCESLKFVIHLQDSLSQETEIRGKELGLRFFRYDQVEKIGKDRKGFYEEKPPKPEDIAALLCTSGSLGEPKGVILTHRNLIASAWASTRTLKEAKKSFGDVDNSITPKDVCISYLSLAHVYPRLIQICALTAGAAIAFSSPDRLLEDLKIVEPTVLALVPRTLYQMYHKVLSEVNSSRWRRLLLDKALENKKEMLSGNSLSENNFWDKYVLQYVRAGLGGRVRLLISAGGFVAPEVLRFFRFSLNCLVMEGYGLTETGGCSLISTESGCLGAPVHCAQVKLSDQPQLGFYSDQNIGEICIKGPHVCGGYWKNPIETFQIFDVDGWLHTGDIGQWLPNGLLKMRERRSYIYPTVKGQFIEPERLESIYALCPYVDFIFLLGFKNEGALVAVVVPRKSSLEKHFPHMDLITLCSHSGVKVRIQRSLEKIARKQRLEPHERLQNIHLHPEALDKDPSMVGLTLKANRERLSQIFVDQIREMFFFSPVLPSQ